jgi:hypothetical protein
VIALLILSGAIIFWKAQPKALSAQTLSPPQPTNSLSSQPSAHTTDAVKGAELSLPAHSPSEKELNRKVQILKEIFTAHNDNDPRLDQEFNRLTPEEKLGFEKLYLQLPAEKLNDRGILVLILARNLETAQDFDFMDRLFREPTCLSLVDCRRPPSTQTDDHGELSSPVTLNYPQLVALEKLKAWPEQHLSADEKTKTAWKNSVNEAQHSQSELVAREARKL